MTLSLFKNKIQTAGLAFRRAHIIAASIGVDNDLRMLVQFHFAKSRARDTGSGPAFDGPVGNGAVDVFGFYE